MSWISSFLSRNTNVVNTHNYEMQQLQKEAIDTENNYLRNMMQIGNNAEGNLTPLSSHQTSIKAPPSYQNAVFLILKR